MGKKGESETRMVNDYSHAGAEINLFLYARLFVSLRQRSCVGYLPGLLIVILATMVVIVSVTTVFFSPVVIGRLLLDRSGLALATLLGTPRFRTIPVPFTSAMTVGRRRGRQRRVVPNSLLLVLRSFDVRRGNLWQRGDGTLRRDRSRLLPGAFRFM